MLKKKLFLSLATTFTIFLIFFLLVEYLIDTSNQKRQKYILDYWNNNSLVEPPKEIKDLIDKIHQTINSDQQKITNDDNIHPEIKEYILTNDKYKQAKKKSFIFKQTSLTFIYNYGIVFFDSTVQKNLDSAYNDFFNEESENVIFAKFLEKLVSEFDKPSSKDLLTYFVKDNQYLQYSQYLKVSVIYLANQKGIFVQYPGQIENFDTNKLDFKFTQRPWWRASTGKYPSSIPDSVTNWGITDPYTDNNEKIRSKIIRTYWQKFTYQNKTYVLGLDLFVDWDKDRNFKTYILGLAIPFTNNIFLDSAIGSFIITLAIFILYNFKILKFRTIIDKLIFIIYNRLSNTEKLLQIKIRLREKYYATTEVNSKTLKIEGKAKISTSLTTSNKYGWGIEVNPLKVNSSREDTHLEEFAQDYTLSKEYNLCINNGSRVLLKGVEIWDVVIVSSSVLSDYLGHFEVLWHTENSSSKELTINNAFWSSQEYKNYRPVIEKQLNDYLLKNGTRENLINENPETIEEISVVLDNSYKEISQNIPESLKKIDMIGETINKISYFNRSKILFEGFEILTKLSFLGKFKAILSRVFFERLNENNALSKVFNEVFQQNKLHPEIFFVEDKKNDLQEFYNNLADSEKSIFVQSPIEVIVYKSDLNIAEFKDFCLIEVEKNSQIIIYLSSLNNTSSSRITGWISWRDVDVNFYTILLQTWISPPNQRQKISSYLKRP